MRSPAQRGRLVLLLSLAATTLAAAQTKRQAPDPINSASLSTRSTSAASSAQNVDGLAILTAALDSRHRIVTRRDCSHFVHDLYEQAGFHYEYASSTDLYAGVDEFRQVTYPQPGDLIVWRGHVGIVVNPVQRSFFSLLRSGAGIDLYDSSYWRRRGRPRFFHYVKTAPVETSSPIRNASWKSFGRSKNVRSNDDEPTSDDTAMNESDESAVETSAPARQPQPQTADTPVTRAVVINASKPQPVQARDAFLQTCKESEHNRHAHDLFNPSQSVIVFDQIEVKKVHIKGNEGWAEVQISEPVSLADQKAEVHRRTEHQRWTLTRRSSTSWELAPPPNTIYVTQATAVRLLASELAQLTADNNSAEKTQQKAQLARALDALLASSRASRNTD